MLKQRGFVFGSAERQLEGSACMQFANRHQILVKLIDAHSRLFAIVCRVYEPENQLNRSSVKSSLLKGNTISYEAFKLTLKLSEIRDCIDSKISVVLQF